MFCSVIVVVFVVVVFAVVVAVCFILVKIGGFIFSTCPGDADV